MQGIGTKGIETSQPSSINPQLYTLHPTPYTLQGYLAHKKHPPHYDQAPWHRATVGSFGGVVYYKRGTPVPLNPHTLNGRCGFNKPLDGEVTKSVQGIGTKALGYSNVSM